MRVKDIPSYGEEELSRLDGVEEVAAAGREQEGRQGVQQVHADTQQQLEYV